MANDVADMQAFKAKREAERAAATGEQPELPLYGGGGGGPMEPTLGMKDYVDARDDAIESRLTASLANLSTKQTVWSATGVIVATLLTIAGLILAALAIGSDRFNGGLSVSPIIAQVQSEQKKTDEAQDAKLEVIDRKLDLLIERSGRKP